MRGSTGADEDDDAEAADLPERLWLVERTYSDDELNVVILVYATPDGRRYHRKERALTSFQNASGTPVAIDLPGKKLGETDPDDVERYAREAARMAERHDPDEVI